MLIALFHNHSHFISTNHTHLPPFTTLQLYSFHHHHRHSPNTTYPHSLFHFLPHKPTTQLLSYLPFKIHNQSPLLSVSLPLQTWRNFTPTGTNILAALVLKGRRSIFNSGQLFSFIIFSNRSSTTWPFAFFFFFVLFPHTSVSAPASPH